MAERDAFGRDPNENTLEGLGSLGSDPVVAPDREPAVATERAPASGAASPERPAFRTAGGGVPEFTLPPGAARMAKRVILGFVVVVTLFAALSTGVAIWLTTDGSDDSGPAMPAPAEPTPEVPGPAVPGSETPGARGTETPDAPRAATPATPAIPPRPTPPPAPTAVPRGLEPRSMLLRSNLARALARLRAAGLGRLRTLRVAPERVDAQLLTRGGRLRSVQVRFDGELRAFSTSGPGFNHLPTVPFARVNRAAPSRMARGAAGRLRRPVSQVDYAVLLTGLGQSADWTVVMRNGAQFLGDSRGRIGRRIN